MTRNLDHAHFVNADRLSSSGLTIDMLAHGIKYTHGIFDMIDEALLSSGEVRLADMIELANLSSMVGNFLGSGIAKASKGIFKRNGPHKYPDLLAQTALASDIEIKVALETNKPKGHLAKSGYYLTCRYVLCDGSGNYKNNLRGNITSIWEIRFGWLDNEDFNLSNTEGDSGKTAVINAVGMKKLEIIYFDLDICPYSKKGGTYQKYTRLSPSQSHLI